MICKKCSKPFEPSKGLINYCSLQCRNSRSWSIIDRENKRNAILHNPVSLEKVKLGGIKGNLNQIHIRHRSICPVCNIEIISSPSRKQKYHMNCYKTVAGGIRNGSSRGKCGWYKGFWCDSSYELVWVIYNIDHDIPFERNKQSFEYEYNGKEYKYYPDFIQNGVYIEIKGYVTEQVIAKINSVNNIKVLLREDLEKEFEYVIMTYGKRFIELYDK